MHVSPHSGGSWSWNRPSSRSCQHQQHSCQQQLLLSQLWIVSTHLSFKQFANTSFSQVLVSCSLVGSLSVTSDRFREPLTVLTLGWKVKRYGSQGRVSGTAIAALVTVCEGIHLWPMDCLPKGSIQRNCLLVVSFNFQYFLCRTTQNWCGPPSISTGWFAGRPRIFHLAAALHGNWVVVFRVGELCLPWLHVVQ